MSRSHLRVLCVIDTIRVGGGAEQLLVDLLPEMQRRGVDVEVAVLMDSPVHHGADLERAGIKVHRLGLAGPRSLVEAVRKLRALGRAGHYDAFWGHLYYGNFYAWLARRLAGRGAVVATLHSVGYSQARPGGLWGRLSVEVERFVLASADRCVAVSQAVREDFAPFLGLGGIRVVHNGVACRRLDTLVSGDPEQVRSSFGFSADDFLIVTPATFVAKKGHTVLLEALEVLRDDRGLRPKALLCGDGPLAAEVERKVAARGLSGQVTVSPVIPHERLMPLIAAADVVVLPSLREPFGIAGAEAMALGTSCILTDVDGFREFTAGADCALLVRPGDAGALADAIHRLHREPDLTEKLGRRGKAHIRKGFDMPICVARWVEILDGAVVEARRPGA